jgi:Skp family chaperone for outer membrane proteins
MKRTLILAFAIGALLAMLMSASPAAAASGADFGTCVADHAQTEGGFSAAHNPGMHQGFAGWPCCPG